MSDLAALAAKWSALAWQAVADGRPEVAQIYDRCRRDIGDHSPEPPASEPGAFACD